MSTKARSLYMETTEISASKTAAEISTLLVEAGAREISLQYGETNNLVGLRFVLVVEGTPVQFALPVRVEPVFKILNGRRKQYGQFSRGMMVKQDREQAERVAWRQLLRWIQAQLAMIDTGMVQAQEVFLPYLLHAGTQQTLFEYFKGDGMKLLAAGQP